MKDEERTPLRTVLINFLNHIENLESDKFPDENYDSEFQDLKLFSEGVKGLKQYSCFEGEKEVNRKKNRYKDILPFDLSRVILNEYAGVPGSDYINANYIKGSSGSIAYIASQGPLPNTVNDFWRMVVQCEVQVIVMACNEEEAGKRKCERYWVEEGEDRQFGLVNVKLLKASTVCPDFSVRTMRLKYTNSQSVIEERTVCQLHYVAWPDHGVPTVVQPLLDMVRLLRDTQASETLPVLVHCSAGCGRTGTICAIDYVWGLLRNGKLTKDFSLLSLVRKMRRQRIAMVQTKEQYVLVHQAVRELFKEQLCMIDSHPYENIDSNGMIRIKEEPVYDVVGIIPDANEEKQDDKKEKEVFLPALPQKRPTSVLCSKQKKEVQNFTARQKLIDHGDLFREHPSPLSVMSGPVSKFKKLKSQFEINSNMPACNSIRKLSVISNKNHEVALPIPSRGVLKVPQLECQNSKTYIKRSKSLKILSSEERLSIYNEIPTDLQQCQPMSGVDSKVEDNENSWDEHCSKYYGGSKYNTKDTNDTSVCQIVKGYEALSLASNRRQLRRSYTTLDMRQKPFSYNQSQTPGLSVNIDTADVPNNNKNNLLRSRTQLELWKLANNINIRKDSESCNTKPQVYSSKRSTCENSSHSCQKLAVELAFNTEANYMNEKACNIAQGPVNKCVYNCSNVSGPERNSERFQHLSLRSKTVKEVAKKSEPVKPLIVKPEETSGVFCDSQFKFDECQSQNSSFQQIHSPLTPAPSNDVQNHYANVSRNLNESKKVMTSSKPENIIVPNSGATHMKVKYPDHITHWKPQSNISYSNSDKEKTGNPNRVVQDPIYSNANISNTTAWNNTKSIGFNRNPHKSSTVLNSSSVNHKMVSHTYPKHAHVSPYNDTLDSSHFKPTQIPSMCPARNVKSLLPGKVVSKFGKEKKSDSISLQSRIGPNKIMSKQTKSGIYKEATIEDKVLNNAQLDSASFPCSSLCHSPPNDVGVYNPSGQESCLIYDNGEARVPHQVIFNWDSNQQWQSAPGVDIDQVAASISQKDGSRNKIIKAALEVLHLRKSKTPSTGLETSEHSLGK